MTAKKGYHKFTLDTVERLMRGIRMGLTYELACMHAGISRDTFENWRKGRFPRKLTDSEKEMKDNFLDMLTRAEGDAAARHMSTIMQAAAQGDWKASAWALERRWPDQFGKPSASVNVNLDIQISQYLDKVAEEEGLTAAERNEFEADVTEYLKKAGKT